MKQIFPPKTDETTSDFFLKAAQLARRAHKNQRDNLGVDYMSHVLSVAAVVRPLGEIYEVVALLHDTVEDCEDRDIVSLPIIEEMFGQEVRDAVDCITKRPGEAYGAYLDRVLTNHIATSVKRADLEHNQSRLHLLEDTEQRKRLEQKYSTARKVLFP